MSSNDAVFERRGPVATLTFNRPAVRNAMTWEMYEALVQACDTVDADPNLHVLVLRASGNKAFVAGTDIGQFERFHGSDDGVSYEERLDGVLERLERVSKPTIAVVMGIAAGGGCAIALTCDLRIVSPDAKFGIPIARTLGNCLSAALCSRLVDLVGPARTKDLVFTGRFVDAFEAQSLGLVNRIVPADTIDSAVDEYVAEIAANAPLTLRVAKELVRRIAVHRRLPQGADRDQIAMCYGSDDFKEGVAAFLAKRRPQWKGR